MRTLSLRGRVLTLFSLFMAFVMGAVALALISNAREAIRAETSASRDLAKKFSLAAIGALVQSRSAEAVMVDLPVHLQQPRHVRLTILDQRGVPVEGRKIATNQSSKTSVVVPPMWFQNLVRPPKELVRVPVIKDNRPLGYVLITTEPFDEVSEIWVDIRAFFIIMFLGCAVVLITTYFAVGRALKPLAVISRGLAQLEAGEYKVNVPQTNVPDLNLITHRFNALASQLDRATREKEKLSHKLITVEDNERKNIAHELHDEFGPCLFGIKVDANYIQTNAKGALNGQGEEIADRAGAILKIVDHIQDHNRALLHRLRPMAIGHFGLPQLLQKLVQDFSNRYVSTRWALDVSEDLTSGGESFDLTVYRMVQECLTNVVRHSGASSVEVEVGFAADDNYPDRGVVRVSVRDDGKGITKDQRPGIGLSGMQHRVMALGGTFSIFANEPTGAVVCAQIPFTAHDVLGGSVDVTPTNEKQEGVVIQ